MTMINAYGIGAGRAIAEQMDDAPGKIRKEARRKLTAVQLAEQERLKAKLEHRSIEFSATESQCLYGESISDERHSLRKSKADQIKDFQDQLLGEERISETDNQAKAQALRVTSSAASLPEFSQVQNNFQHQSIDTIQANPVVQSPGKFLFELARLPGKLTRDRALSSLDLLKESIRSHHASELTQEDREGVLGYLEFLDGYFDGGPKTAGQSEKITALMAEIRIQLNVAADPARAGLIQHHVVTNLSADVVPASGAPREARKASKRVKEGVADDDSDSGIDGSIAAQENRAALLPPSGMTAASPASQSSLSKDSGRRRDETIVSVTLRSV